jgi:hypothetical protein
MGSLTIEQLAGEIQEYAMLSGGGISIHHVMRLMSYEEQADESFVLPGWETYIDAIVWLHVRGYGRAALDDVGQVAGFIMNEPATEDGSHELYM